jgi:transposase InsO family protein
VLGTLAGLRTPTYAQGIGVAGFHLHFLRQDMALIERQPKPGLVNHSDRGVQYASQDYTGMLKQHGAAISMSHKGNPYDNAACESFIKTLKYEEVYRNEYRDFEDARGSIGEFLDRVYNQKRVHSALGYLPPTEFENGATA